MTTRPQPQPNHAPKTTPKHRPNQPAQPKPALATRPAGPALFQRAIANPNMLAPAGVLGLQRTVGNRAVSRLLTGLSSGRQITPGRTAGQANSSLQRPNEALIQRNHDDDETTIDWAAATEVKPSTSGMLGGVFFITVAGEKHVVKPTNSVAASLFGEKMLAGIGGAKIPDSTPIRRDSLEGNQIIGAIEAKLNTANDEIRDSYVSKLEVFRNASYLLVQKNLGGGVKLSLEDLNIRINKEQKKDGGGDLMGLQPEIEAQVADQIVLLENETLMKNVGKSLAADTLIGNADRFEGMNTENAFLYTDDNTIGAIDTEAILQNIEAMKEFYGPESEQLPHAGKGQNLIELGVSPATNYVNFVLGHKTLPGKGVQITSEWGGGASSSNVMRILTNFDGWFNDKFVDKFTGNYFSTIPVREKFAQLGYPPKTAQNYPERWAGIKINIKAGLDEGLHMAKEMMSGQQRQELKTTFKGLETRFGSNINFDWDALKIKGNYIKAISEGQDPEEARQAAIEYVTRKERIKAGSDLIPKIVRVLTFGQQVGIIAPSENMKLKKRLSELFPQQQKLLIHVRDVSEKKFKGTFRSKSENKRLSRRYELARAALLKRYLVLSGEKNNNQNEAYQAVSTTAPTIGKNLLKGGDKAKTTLRTLLQSVGTNVEFD